MEELATALFASWQPRRANIKGDEGLYFATVEITGTRNISGECNCGRYFPGNLLYISFVA